MISQRRKAAYGGLFGLALGLAQIWLLTHFSDKELGTYNGFLMVAGSIGVIGGSAMCGVLAALNTELKGLKWGGMLRAAAGVCGGFVLLISARRVGSHWATVAVAYLGILMVVIALFIGIYIRRR